ncbi:MAG: GNAT family N-acetyltransferase [Archangium sp.]|nr:GNAT family N-acetyltransferase [Archangium sp.]
MLRETEEGDLPALYEHQRDPEAARMAAFTPRDLPAFLHHWRTRILGDPRVRARTIVVDERIAGFVSSWTQGEARLIAYWVAREHWGRGVATAALAEFVERVDPMRPLDAFVATSNHGSVRVLEKCGFGLVAGSAETGPDGVEEVRYRLGSP